MLSLDEREFAHKHPALGPVSFPVVIVPTRGKENTRPKNQRHFKNVGLKLKPKLRAPDIPRLARAVFVLSSGSISKGTHLGRYQPEPKLRRCAVGIVERLGGWLVLLVELRLCFSWGSGFREFSSLVNRSRQTEPKLKQKPCLMGCISSKLDFYLACPVAPGRILV